MLYKAERVHGSGEQCVINDFSPFPKELTVSNFLRQMRTIEGEGVLMPVPTEEKIRNLCAQVLSAQNEIALKKAVAELRAAIHEHIQNTRNRAAEAIPGTFHSDEKDAA
jgi:hypothetical protein